MNECISSTAKVLNIMYLVKKVNKFLATQPLVVSLYKVTLNPEQVRLSVNTIPHENHEISRKYFFCVFVCFGGFF